MYLSIGWEKRITDSISAITIAGTCNAASFTIFQNIPLSGGFHVNFTPLISVLHQLDQKIIYPHYDFKHLTEKYFEIGMKLDDFLIQLVKYCIRQIIYFLGEIDIQVIDRFPKIFYIQYYLFILVLHEITYHVINMGLNFHRSIKSQLLIFIEKFIQFRDFLISSGIAKIYH